MLQNIVNILTFPRTAYKAYTLCIIQNKRIPELEAIIATNAHYSYCYVLDVIKGRFELGEKVILKSIYAQEYKKRFLKESSYA